MNRRLVQQFAHSTAAALLAMAPLVAGAQATAMKPNLGAAANVVKFTPNLRLSALAARPDSDLVELSDGRRVRLGEARRLEAAVQKARAARHPDVLPALARKPAATGVPVRDPSELAAALKRNDQDTVVLPSGRRATVAQLRIAKELADKQRASAAASASQRPNLAGPAIRVTAQTDMKALMSRPDSTVLESPKGTRVTVGEIKQYFAQKNRAAAPR